MYNNEYANEGTLLTNARLSPEENLMALLRITLGDELVSRITGYRVEEGYNVREDIETKQLFGYNSVLQLDLDNPNHELPDYFKLFYNRLEPGYHLYHTRELIYDVKKYGEFTGHKESDNLRVKKMVEESGLFSISDKHRLIVRLEDDEPIIIVAAEENNPVYLGFRKLPIKIVR